MISCIFLFMDMLNWESLLRLMNVSRSFEVEIKGRLEEMYNQLNKSMVPAATMISTRFCDACEGTLFSEDDTKFVYFRQDELPKRVYVVCESKWKCRLSALISRAIVSARQNRFYLLRDASPGREMMIPRSNGDSTLARLTSPKIVIAHLQRGPMFEFDWFHDEKRYSKWVNWNKLLTPPRELTEGEQKGLRHLNTCLVPDVIGHIKKFLSYPTRFKMTFPKWNLISSLRHCSDEHLSVLWNNK